MKMDWSIAYKHVRVHESDHNLIIQLAELKSRMDKRLNCQQLDNNCSAGPEGSLILRRYRKHYRDIAEKIGVKLAPEDDPSKAFPPSTEGEILEMIYNGKDWTYFLPCLVMH